ncbi:hypothetical protein ACFX2I_016954 [Malus domestica]
MSNNQAIGQDDPNEQLEKKIKGRETLLREHEARLSVLRSNGFQLGNFYLVFQGVILTAIASSTKVFTCNDSWLLILLCVLAACPNLAALYLIGQEYIRTLSQRDKCLVDCDNLNAERSRLNNAGPQQNPVARTPPPGQTPTTGGTPPRGETPAPGTPPLQVPATRGDDDYWGKLKRTVFLFGCMAFFLGVSAIMVLACRKILCRAVADCKLPSSLSKKCIRLCDEGSKCLTICRN